MAYDAARERIVLFGGWQSDVNQLLADTWTWDGTSWNLQLVTGPPAVRDHAMAYDAARQEIVLYGGIDDLGAIRGETWTWNGTQWTMKSPATSPPPAAAEALVYDPTVKRVLLFGGIGNPESAVWAWDGSTWAKFDFPSAPVRRSFTMMTFVPELGGSLLFGGLGAGYRDDTWLLRMPPVQVVDVVSRKTHGAAGAFDITLPLIGDAGIESRSGGASNSHQVLIRFVSPVTFASASVTSGTGNVTSTATSPDSKEVTINLAGVSNAQTITLTLAGVSDGTNTNDVSFQMAVLLGDITANKIVSNSDVAAVKGQISSPVTASNFRSDVNANGIVSNTDVGVTKAQVSTTLP